MASGVTDSGKTTVSFSGRTGRVAGNVSPPSLLDFGDPLGHQEVLTTIVTLAWCWTRAIGADCEDAALVRRDRLLGVDVLGQRDLNGRGRFHLLVVARILRPPAFPGDEECLR
jgi:hypothetical protein